MRVNGAHALLLCMASAFLNACALPTSRHESLIALDKRNGSGISDALFNDFQRFARFSSAVYQSNCSKPAGQKMVERIDHGGSVGLVALDDSRKQIVVVFRGTLNLGDILTDIKFFLTPLRAQNITNVGNASTHTGFLGAYNAIADDMFRVVLGQVKAHPDYSIVVTGHSMGGAVASIASLALREKFPGQDLTLYTFGQPRTGNAAYAKLVEDRIGIDKIYRGVHTFDGVPTILFQYLGYRHHAQEYWQFEEPASPANVRKCNGGEDPNCSDSITSSGINAAHPFYFGQAMVIDSTVCLRA